MENVENQSVLKSMGTERPANRKLRAREPASERTEHAGVIYEMLIGKGYLDEEKLKYARRIHSKLAGHKTLTQVLQELKYITAEQIQDTLSASKVNLKLGALLVELGQITDHDLKTAIRLKKESAVGKTMGEVLVENGLIAEKSLLEVLSYQLGLSYCELEISRLDANLLRKFPDKVVHSASIPAGCQG